MKKPLFLPFLFIIISQIGIAQYTQHTMLPSATDPAITLYNNSNHYCYYPLSAPLNKLVIWYPGTGGVPQNSQLLQQTIADMGYHVISLRYPNDVSVNLTCPTSDPTCYGNWRKEVFDGTERSSYIDVNRANSIENRLIKVLKYLNTNYPSENWNQYWAGDSTIEWCKIMVAGHSQGGGYAAMTSKYYEVNRCVIFAWTDWVTNNTAPWVYTQGPTPGDRYYAFTHQFDDIYSNGKQDTTLVRLGLTNYGPEVLVDGTTAPYSNSHLLTTLETPRTDTTNYHGCISTSIYTPLDSMNIPIFKPVWQYLFSPNSMDCNITSINELPTQRFIEIFPNPSNESVHVNTNNQKIKYVELFNLNGELIHKYYANDFSVSDLPNGIYFITVETEKSVYRNKLIKQ